MSKKYLRKNEFRFDNNPEHFGESGEPHPAYITARYGHKYKANGITHSRKTTQGEDTYWIPENPNKKKGKTDKRKVRITQPYWQKDILFSDEILDNYSFSKKTRAIIKKYNKKFKQ